MAETERNEHRPGLGTWCPPAHFFDAIIRNHVLSDASFIITYPNLPSFPPQKNDPNIIFDVHHTSPINLPFLPIEIPLTPKF